MSRLKERMKYQHHRSGCQMVFAPLNTCDCVELNMLDRIAELEAGTKMVHKRLDWTLNDNVQKALRIEELEAEKKELRTCKTCGQDKAIAEIGERFGYRADVMGLEIKKLQSRIEELEARHDTQAHHYGTKIRQLQSRIEAGLKLADEIQHNKHQPRGGPPYGGHYANLFREALGGNHE